jgi:hypothetical protein
MHPADTAREAHLPGRRALAGFTAGAASVLTVHQAMLAWLHARGHAPWPAYSTTPTAPLGVPAVASAAFWGGLWGAVLAGRLLREPRRGPAFWGRAAALGAVLPTAVGAALLAAGRGASLAGTPPVRALASALLVNAAWGAATAAGLRVLLRRREARPTVRDA